MNKIKILDNLTVQKIAAGEIIERPASIVKELIENSLDADAKNIVVEIKDGGKSLIRVTDDGHGMSREDLRLAFKRHSTSKLNDIDDIYKVLSMGFRGEALASISAVTKIEVLTKTRSSQGGTQALIEDGEIHSMDVVGCPQGTTMIARDLFYNLPVRKDFLKTNSTEGNHISDTVNRLALGNPDVSFKLVRDNKTILNTLRTNSLLETIHRILGKDYSKNLTPVDYQDDYIKIHGFISNNHLYRGNRSHQYIYINKRSIVNTDISRIIENNYKTLIPHNRFPVFVIHISIHPSEIDINIHPTKQEIKFVDNERVLNNINEMIRDNLIPTSHRGTMELGKSKKTKDNDLPKIFEQIEPEEPNNIRIHDLTEMDYNFIDDDSSKYKSDDNHKFQVLKEHEDHKGDSNIITSNEEEVKSLFIRNNKFDINPIGRVFNTYIIAEIDIEEKILFIDQHAAHERIIYEKYKKEYEDEKIITQQLIAPEVINLTNREMDEFNTNIQIFRDLGFDIEEFGPNSIAIRGVPILFGTPKIKDLFIDILDGLDMGIKSSYDTKLDKIMKLACVNAIKSGDKIGREEILALYEDLMSCENPLTCPHGRPTMIELTKRDIEKQFLRII